MKAFVRVMPKLEVNDPQGDTVRQGLHLLGFGEVQSVRVGKYIEITLDAEDAAGARERVEAMCSRLLANQVIEDFEFDLEAPPGP